MSKQTKFKITGPGEYRTRDGRKAMVLHKLRGRPGRPWLGYSVYPDEQIPTLWRPCGSVPDPEKFFPSCDDLVRRVK